MSKGNVALKNKFTQVCVWESTTLGENTPKGFEKFIKEEFDGTRSQYLENILTNPDIDNDMNPIKDTGGRSDLFFAVHEDDIGKFAVPRLNYGIRWVEDIYGNDQGHLYPNRVSKYRSW